VKKQISLKYYESVSVLLRHAPASYYAAVCGYQTIADFIHIISQMTLFSEKGSP